MNKKIFALLCFAATLNMSAVIIVDDDDDLGASCDYCTGCGPKESNAGLAAANCIPKMIYNECGIAKSNSVTQEL
jgi:hypothetical protein